MHEQGWTKAIRRQRAAVKGSRRCKVWSCSWGIGGSAQKVFQESGSSGSFVIYEWSIQASSVLLGFVRVLVEFDRRLGVVQTLSRVCAILSIFLGYSFVLVVMDAMLHEAMVVEGELLSQEALLAGSGSGTSSWADVKADVSEAMHSNATPNFIATETGQATNVVQERKSVFERLEPAVTRELQFGEVIEACGVMEENDEFCLYDQGNVIPSTTTSVMHSGEPMQPMLVQLIEDLGQASKNVELASVEEVMVVTY
ncbi:hypothetical protein L6452_43553 [Arctium lappa]|uniref:Uncharacterized protein n=1 Tax=Arctium lappa TaxID=4217 RepID=A0ACB8XD93_ARCLA|nr:hypothetical protein L6452_43553 [Arctium lappa]